MKILHLCIWIHALIDIWYVWLLTVSCYQCYEYIWMLFKLLSEFVICQKLLVISQLTFTMYTHICTAIWWKEYNNIASLEYPRSQCYDSVPYCTSHTYVQWCISSSIPKPSGTKRDFSLHVLSESFSLVFLPKYTSWKSVLYKTF